MEGMDGVELVKRVRQIDKDCAIVVVSCMNDFETLRKLIPYNINAWDGTPLSIWQLFRELTRNSMKQQG